MRSIATVCVSGTLEAKLQAIAAAGFDAVEIFEPDLLGYAGRPRDAAAMLADLGLECALYQPFRDFEGMPEQLRQRAFDRAERKFDLMGELGADRILVCSNCSPHAIGDHARIVADLHALGDRAAARGIVIGYEALAWGRHIDDHRVAWDLVRRADHASVGIILDSFHSLARGIPVASIADIDPAKIVFVQLADAPALKMDLLFWSRHFRCLPGQGDLPVAAYLAEILRTGYTGPLSLEIFNDRFRASSTSMIAQDGFRSLAALEDQARRLLARPTDMPAPSPIGGVEFVEFTASNEESERLAPILRGLGFTHTGAHRTKHVDRWQQGAINLVVNREPEGFAASYRLVHGAAICALGLRVPNSADALARATALDVPRFAPDAQPGDLRMSALRGVGGSLIYLLDEAGTDRIWAEEFSPLAQSASGAHLVRIDHVAASVDTDEFLSWQLYWTASFDTEKQTELDIPDPAGLVQSRAIESRDGGFRLTINASGGRSTLSSRFLAKGFGAGFQHIAFTSEDIFATAAAMAAAGLAILPIPSNYYDDLAARFGLPETELAHLRDHDILYDEDAEGNVYRQFYSRAFEARFFFEIVERKFYRGYGATNAPIRLGAQSRFKPRADL